MIHPFTTSSPLVAGFVFSSDLVKKTSYLRSYCRFSRKADKNNIYFYSLWETTKKRPLHHFALQSGAHTGFYSGGCGIFRSINYTKKGTFLDCAQRDFLKSLFQEYKFNYFLNYTTLCKDSVNVAKILIFYKRRKGGRNQYDLNCALFTLVAFFTFRIRWLNCFHCYNTWFHNNRTIQSVSFYPSIYHRINLMSEHNINVSFP